MCAARAVFLGIGAEVGPWVAKLEASIFLPREKASPAGGGSFLLGDGALFPCYAFEGKWFRIQPCGVIVLQTIRGDGQDLHTIDGGWAWFLRAGVGAELEYALNDRVAVIAGAYGAIAPSRPSFVVDQETVCCIEQR